MAARPRPSLLLGAALALAALPALAGPGPLHEAQVPQYPGAKAAPTQAGDGPDADEPMRPDVKSRGTKAYVVDAPVEEVVRFYLKRFGAKVDDFDSPDPQTLEPGTAAPVSVALHFHDPQDDHDGVGHVLVPAARKWKVLERCRAPWAPRQWVNDGGFGWAAKQQDGSISNYFVSVVDAGVADRWTGCTKRTRIVVGVEHGKSPEVMEEEKDQADQAELDAAMKAVAKAPTEKELGVPLYPGARYDVRNSAGMSLGDQRAFIFVSDDAPEKVLRFYEQKLGKKAGGDAQDGWMFALKGSLPVPEEGLAVQKNMLPGGGKTAITVMRNKAE